MSYCNVVIMVDCNWVLLQHILLVTILSLVFRYSEIKTLNSTVRKLYPTIQEDIYNNTLFVCSNSMLLDYEV